VTPPLYQLSAGDLRDKVAQGEISAVELARLFLDRAKIHDRRINAYLHLCPERALAEAAAVDRARADGEQLGPLAGVPIAIKDNICTRGIPTTCASKMLAGYLPPYDAHVVEKLRGAGAVLLGKLNLDEFAMGSSTENSAYGPTRNPWDLQRTPGGSSGGPAAAVAACLSPVSLGSDTGGSVRQPASFCGVTAIKPTYGRVSRFGLVAFASSLDQIGPLGRSVRDCARLLSVIGGPDPRDATSVAIPNEDYESACGQKVSGLRVGVVKECFGTGCESSVLDAVTQAVETLRGLGCQPVEVSLPHMRYAVSTYYIVAPAEASSNLARYDGVRYGVRVPGRDLIDMYGKTRAAGFGPEVKRRIMLGSYALSAGYYDAFYLKAQKVRTLIWRDYQDAFRQCDVLVTPTAPTCAFGLGEKLSDPLAMYLQDIFTLPISLAGIPAASVPCGFSPEGLPIGMQICAPAFMERRLVQVAHAYEEASGLNGRYPQHFS
jgi:aspartyl-tRNA(Asn)/glutamyl-tRNA(Gln) amidotransferase subunit A